MGGSRHGSSDGGGNGMVAVVKYFVSWSADRGAREAPNHVHYAKGGVIFWINGLQRNQEVRENAAVSCTTRNERHSLTKHQARLYEAIIATLNCAAHCPQQEEESSHICMSLLSVRTTSPDWCEDHPTSCEYELLELLIVGGIILRAPCVEVGLQQNSSKI